ncbi:MAG: 23S rRNA (guanosine-2'-O-) -methyltransferase rlmB [Ignavibacteriae bacterium]|nr:MAG: 23S rRNA (guanosine-2'-O-) -methyltransferase rlmB [Ignavibacteriota bacterium]
MKIIKIESLDNPDLYPYRTLRRAIEHIKKRIFVAEGEKVVRRLLESNLSIESFLLTEDWYEVLKNFITNRCNSDIPVYIGTKKMLESIVGFNLHQGIMAVGKIPEPIALDELIDDNCSSHFFVAVDGLTNSDNLGVIVRNCVAFNVDALIVGETSSSPYLRRAIRQSMGAVFELKIFESDNLYEDIRKISQVYDFEIIAADPHGEKIISEKIGYRKNICIVFGSEGFGIREDIIAICNERVNIPISQKIDSLNVASASAIFLYEINKLRTNCY